MQRKIKFRAWDKQNKSMEEVELLGDAVLRIKHAEWEDREDFEVMQYTGLKDKNDKEIYEGDIVVAVNIDDTFTGVVVFDLEELDFKVTNGKKNYRNNFSYLCTCEEIEIIGNIYENLELLKEGE